MVQRVDDDVDSEGNGGHGGFISATQDAAISPNKRLAAANTWREVLPSVVKCADVVHRINTIIFQCIFLGD